jgi:diguanylate cyclase (GGDEF)-like protein
VLLVDDDPDINEVFKLALTSMGYACETASSGKQALFKLANSRPDLVLLDMRLGREIDGADILYQIRSNPRFDQTRVMIITAYPLMAEQVTSLADLVLIKPVTIDHLQGLIERLEITLRDASQDTSGGAQVKDPFEYFRDPITGLFNQNYFYTRLEHAMESARRRPDTLFATFVLGFDPSTSKGTKPLNGQRQFLLKQIADRLRLNLRPSDAIARLTGNAFATLHEGLRRPQDTILILERIDETLQPPYKVENEIYQLDFTIGAAIHDRRYTSIQEMLTVAQGAMLQARSRGKGRRLLVTSFGEPPVAL